MGGQRRDRDGTGAREGNGSTGGGTGTPAAIERGLGGQVRGLGWPEAHKGNGRTEKGLGGWRRGLGSPGQL